MARVKVCRLCGQHNQPDELFCVAADCGASLADVSTVDTSELERLTAEEAVVEDGSVDSGVEDQQNQAANVGGHTIGEDQVAPCVLVFPWGPETIDGLLGVGRDAEFSPLSGQLDAFPAVSRKHAMVGIEQGHWAVMDRGSTNGTYLNGQRLVENEKVLIQDGDLLRFSQGLLVRVEIAATGGASGTPSY